MVRFPTWSGEFFLPIKRPHQSLSFPSSCLKGVRFSFPSGKVVRDIRKFNYRCLGLDAYGGTKATTTGD